MVTVDLRSEVLIGMGRVYADILVVVLMSFFLKGTDTGVFFRNIELKRFCHFIFSSFPDLAKVFGYEFSNS